MGRFQLDFRKCMLIIPALQKWTRLPGERARALCLEVCERWVDGPPPGKLGEIPALGVVQLNSP